MGKWLIIEPEICTEVKKKCKENTGSKAYQSIFDELERYVKGEELKEGEVKLQEIAVSVYNRFKNDIPSTDTIKRVYGAKGGKAGVAENNMLFPDLLTYYAFGISYDDKLKELNREKVWKDYGQDDDDNEESSEINLQVPEHLFGIYEGFYLRAKGDKESDKIIRLTLLIADDRTVIVRTTRAEEVSKGNKYFEGECLNLNDMTLELRFSIGEESEVYTFLFVFYIAHKHATPFNGYLKGIYAGSDPTTKQPVAGRMMLHQLTSWQDLSKDKRTETIIEQFKTDDTYKPTTLTDEEAFKEFEKKDGNGKQPFSEFYIEEVKYIENTEVLNKYINRTDEFPDIVGCFSFFSLHSKGEYINRGIAKIVSTGRVIINGSLRNGKIKKYSGWVDILDNDVISINVNEQETDGELVSYLIKVDKTKKENSYNGVRIMVTDDKHHKPFASRVILIREDDTFYTDDKSLEKISLFPTDEAGFNKLNLLKDHFTAKGYKDILTFLTGFENNIIKSFSSDRTELNFSRDIHYGENFLTISKMYASKDNYDRFIINLHYARMHGLTDYKIIEQDKDIQAYFKRTPNAKDKIDTYSVGAKTHFKINSKEVTIVKNRIKNEAASTDTE